MNYLNLYSHNFLFTKVKKHLIEDNGNVESILTMIPLLILFLSVFQLCGSSLSRIVYLGKANDVATSQTFENPNPIVNSYPLTMNLIDGGKIIITEQQHYLPALSPLIPNGDSFYSYGMSVS